MYTRLHPPVRLRPLVSRDLNLLDSWWNEPQASYLDSGDPEGPEREFRDQFIQELLQGGSHGWSIIENAAGVPVGYVLYRVYENEPGRAEIAIRLSERYWGQGLASSALERFLSHLFHRRQLVEVWLTVYVFNPRAIRLYEKFGFRTIESFTDTQGLELFKMTLPRQTWLDMNRSEACG